MFMKYKKRKEIEIEKLETTKIPVCRNINLVDNLFRKVCVDCVRSNLTFCCHLAFACL